MRKLRSFSCRNCTIYIPTSKAQALLFSTSSPTLVITVFSMIAFLTSIKWSHCGFALLFWLVLSILSLVIRMSSLEKTSVHILYLFLVSFFYVELYQFFYILDIKPSSEVSFANIFSHSLSCLFILFIVSFSVQPLFSLMQAHLFIFAFLFLPKETDPKNCYWDQCW